jgi:hypothetical protein
MRHLFTPIVTGLALAALTPVHATAQNATADISLATTAPEPSMNHVRASEPEIHALLEAGRLHSPTFRKLLETLDASDVIVYVGPRLSRGDLYAYLVHNVVDSGGHRYLRVFVDTSGAWRRLVSSLGHELQHAVEVAQAPEARDTEGLARMFEGASKGARCASDARNCYETKLAIAVGNAVFDELDTVPNAALRSSRPAR